MKLYLTRNQVLGAIIFLRRKDAGLNQEEVAQRLGFSTQSAYSRLEIGKSPITVEVLMRVEDMLDIESGTLMNEADAFLDRIGKDGQVTILLRGDTSDGMVALGQDALRIALLGAGKGATSNG